MLRTGRVTLPERETFGGHRRVVPGMKPINEAQLAERGLAVVEVAAADDETAFTVQ
ncbi:DUF6207 family protein [Streptomyces griseoaurantiacus]|uniref:DUF6207 family protein n=1 Tax=Streptomyces griseoaurantiacus TaxID=68213 RepID=UPI0036C2BE7F